MLASSSCFGNYQEISAAYSTCICAGLCSSDYPAIPISSVPVPSGFVPFGCFAPIFRSVT